MDPCLFGNKYGSVPIGHGVKLKEEYDTIKMVLLMLFICCTQFYWKCKLTNYQNLFNQLLVSYHMLGCNMSLKLYYLKSHHLNKLISLITW